MTRPCAFEWDGEVMRPLHPRRADCEYAVGERYMLAPYEDRSDATHRHEFAFLRDAWMTLPEHIAESFPSPEHLRKRALIEAGYYDETVIDAGTNAAALRVAAAFRQIDDFALVIVRGPAVVRRTAKSQSRRMMDRKTFQESKSAILEIVSEMIGVSTNTLRSQSGGATPARQLEKACC